MSWQRLYEQYPNEIDAIKWNKYRNTVWWRKIQKDKIKLLEKTNIGLPKERVYLMI